MSRITTEVTTVGTRNAAKYGGEYPCEVLVKADGVTVGLAEARVSPAETRHRLVNGREYYEVLSLKVTAWTWYAHGCDVEPELYATRDEALAACLAFIREAIGETE